MAPRLAEETGDAANDVSREAEDDTAAEEVTEDARTPAEPDADEPEPAADETDDAVAVTEDTDDGAGPAGDEDGPAFDIADRRASMTADRTGVRFRLDEEEAEFGWSEIGAVEVEIPRFGRRFTVNLHTTARRSYQSEVDAPSRGALKQWTADLDVVLDAYFEES
ncbi:hypothetical protein OG875_28155 [Streptomyces sp. NBC_01498]|uniref:hypothetical protein n=1 Tax=Streptomyces sp. NBC_01498 TaxID=2975870 RepID=UPI002E7C468B|nr:hypothetical protein [Streptomyces sp. NBC_01498]WTL28111.1 hypothetical protein OG875_28155 [Streptomyces sp. NBC_01498]